MRVLARSLPHTQIMNWVPFPAVYSLMKAKILQRVPPTLSVVTGNGMFSISIRYMFLVSSTRVEERGGVFSISISATRSW